MTSTSGVARRRSATGMESAESVQNVATVARAIASARPRRVVCINGESAGRPFAGQPRREGLVPPYDAAAMLVPHRGRSKPDRSAIQ
jgi:hypothetical protein